MGLFWNRKTFWNNLDFLDFNLPNQQLCQVIRVFLNMHCNFNLGQRISRKIFLTTTLTAKKTVITNMASTQSGRDLEGILPLIVLCVDELMENDEIEKLRKYSCPVFDCAW